MMFAYFTHSEISDNYKYIILEFKMQYNGMNLSLLRDQTSAKRAGACCFCERDRR